MPVDEENGTILIIEDDLDIAGMLNDYFRVQGYDVITANWGEDGIRSCEQNQPDIIILDIRLPDIDGFEVARRLRDDRKTKEIPIIFLTEKRQREDRLTGLKLGADDYITKPFDVQELRLRVRNTLRRSRQTALNNPITGLPEGRLIDEHLKMISGRDDWALLIIICKNLDYFREVYGFVASDDFLRAVSLMLKEEVEDRLSPAGFLGQLSHHNFLVIAQAAQLTALKTGIQSRLEKSFSYFYRDQDHDTGVFKEHPLSVEFHEIQPEAKTQYHLDDLKSILLQYTK